MKEHNKKEKNIRPAPPDITLKLKEDTFMKPKKLFVVAGCALLACGFASPGNGFAETLSNVKNIVSYNEHKESHALSGNLHIVGSYMLGNLLTLWAEKFSEYHPKANIEIDSRGLSSDVPALISGTARIAIMSRPMKPEEIGEFAKKFGYQPTTLRVAVDTPAIFVHKDNPIKGITLAQVNSMFTSARRADQSEKITRWGQLGLTGEWADQPIRLYARKASSGISGLVSVVQGVASDRQSIGYSGIRHVTPDVRAVPIARENGETFVEASVDNALSGEYPLTRFLYLSINKAPNEAFDPMVREFVRLAFSREGQQALIDSGYSPLSDKMVADEKNHLDEIVGVLLASSRDSQ
jgi:phosphate transport system substrate-binding protein